MRTEDEDSVCQEYDSRIRNDEDSTTSTQQPSEGLLENNVLEETDRLAALIVETLGDSSYKTYANAVAQYLIFVRGFTYAEVAHRLVDKSHRDKSVASLKKLFACSSELLDCVPRPIGIEIIARMSADKIQKSLNVKHLQTKRDTGKGGSGIVPNIKPVILHSHPTYVWLRFRVPAKVDSEIENVEFPYDGELVSVSKRVYEVYIKKQPRTLLADVSFVATWLEQNMQANLIFCSELALFLYNKPLFVSNYLKFMWCYACDRPSFDPKTHEELQLVCVYMLYSTLFMRTNNLTSMPEESHNPLITYTGERPKIAMSKFDLSREYAVEGTRAMQTVNMGSDFGANSNYVEVTTKIKLRNSSILSIV